MTGRVVVIGVGNPYRRDDGAGPAVIEALRAAPPKDAVLTDGDGEPGRMLGLWRRQDAVIVVEVVHAHPGRPGRLHTLTAERAARCAAPSASTHALGLGETFALAAALDRMPRELTVHAVEGADFGLGHGLSTAVADALPELIRRVAGAIDEAHDRLRHTSALADDRGSEAPCP
ncbi:hydrogenase maturation protease [Streptomyces antioxidans]|uniref:Hydrogenase maturation protease n=1 Tax=Streptomyces antioxidans TaxID=1507734 RepID=A0A1V4D7D5_9ACTN|nr:hydrogenase maturation protease [Streptomyces antioxidans]OPF80979.1 hydrogenase maturation protease [Streptomyces antioxidans]